MKNTAHFLFTKNLDRIKSKFLTYHGSRKYNGYCCNHYCCWLRDYRFTSHQGKHLDSVNPQSIGDFIPKALSREPSWFFQFGKPTALQQVQRWAQDYKFEKTLAPRVDRAIDQWLLTQPSGITPPKIIEYPVDPSVQTGDSQLLGGAIEIKSPWANH